MKRTIFVLVVLTWLTTLASAQEPVIPRELIPINASNVTGLERVARISGNEKPIHSVSVSPFGLLAYTYGLDGTGDFGVAVWDMINETRLFTVLLPEIIIDGQISPVGNLLAIASNTGEGGKVRIVNIATQEVIGNISTEFQIQNIGYSPDGQILVIVGDSVFFVSDNITVELTAHESEVKSVAFAPNNSVMATGDLDGTIVIWDVETQEPIRTLSRGLSISDLAFKADGTTLIVSSTESSLFSLWNIETGEIIQEIESHREGVRALASNPDSSLLISGGNDNRTRLWNAQSGELLRVLTENIAPISDIQINQAGTWLTVGSIDGTVRVWVIPICSITSDEAVNMRTGGGLNFAVGNQFPVGTRLKVINRLTDEIGYTWWQTENQLWVREDVVEDRGACEVVPEDN